jgi:hypothetical protein
MSNGKLLCDSPAFEQILMQSGSQAAGKKKKK